MSTTNSAGLAEFLVSSALEEGFADAQIISIREIFDRIDNYSQNYKSFDYKSLCDFPGSESHPGSGSFLVCALAYPAQIPYAVKHNTGEARPGVFPGPPPHAHVAPFAVRHYYRAAVEKLGKIKKTAAARFNLRESDFRSFSNSRIPEKIIFWASGLGEYGRSGLIIHPRLGTRFIIALLYVHRFLSAASSSEALRPPGSLCGSCTACVQTCPASALSGDGSLDTTRCLQARATRLETWDEETKLEWGMRFYGCDTCQEVCPHNTKAFHDSDIENGLLGDRISIIEFLSCTEDEIKKAFKGTALGMSWIPLQALVRNAIVALGNYMTEGNSFTKADIGRGRDCIAVTSVVELAALIKKYSGHQNKVLAEAAKWALEKIEIKI
ncbi:MAG: 4Fe-4S dicluster domain-containing protein [Spirochaetaceae bacterium]|nr:MAG: 4Fe-4S dicluster domain-containing protein [Spirochaetaceae bacterium]